MSLIEQVGVLHAHSRYSDACGTVPEIMRAAREARLDFLVLTDHDSLAPLREAWPGLHEGVRLLVGAEVTPRKAGHVLALRVRSCAGYAVQHNLRTLDAIAAQGGFAVVAHPMGKHKPTLRIHHTPWYDWNHPALRGLEIWSFMHDWVEEVAWWRLPRAYEFWNHPEDRLAGPYASVLREWDRRGRTRRLSGLAGLDVHAHRIPLTERHIFPYARMFKALRNHVFVDAARLIEAPEETLWLAHEEGRAFVALDYLADSKGTLCCARLPDGREMQMGEEAPFAAGAVTTLALPRKAEIRWIADGRCRLRETTDALSARPAGPGVYRFEARLEGRPWLYTNPFYFRPGA